MQIIYSDIKDQTLLNAAKKLAEIGYSVKAKEIPQRYGSAIHYSFVAKSNFVSVRGTNERGSSYNIQNPNGTTTQSYTNQYFSVYVRNKNGGYEIKKRTGLFSEALEYAENILKNQDIPKTVRHSDEMPPPFAFTNKCNLSSRESYAPTPGGNYVMATCVYRNPIVKECAVVGIGAIDTKLNVTEANALNPNGDAWFMMHCYGSYGRFHIITDGEGWFPLRKASDGSYKASLSTTVRGSDLSMMNLYDKATIMMAIKLYLGKNEA